MPEPVSRDRSWLAPASLLSGDAELAGHDGDRQGVGPVAVDDAGDLPLTPQAAHGARARGAPDFGGEYDFGHGGSPQVARAVVADGSQASGERPVSLSPLSAPEIASDGPDLRDPGVLRSTIPRGEGPTDLEVQPPTFQ